VAETKDLITLTAVTDFEVPMYHMGEIDFRYSTEELAEHIEKYGADELLSMLGFMQHIVWTAKLQIAHNNEVSGTRAEPQEGVDG